MDEELKALAREYDEGRLNGIRNHLLQFATSRAADVARILPRNANDKELLDALKTVVKARGSIHLPSEMADQIREINNEIWFRGEKGDFDRPKIKEEWAMRYAGAWRTWRIKEILYLCDRDAEPICACLRKVMQPQATA